MDHVSNELRARIEEKIAQLDLVANEIPGVIIIHRLPEFIVEYISPRGLKYFGITMEDIKQIGGDYHASFFNEEDATDYLPKVIAMIERNEPDEHASYFQQVRKSASDPWNWYFSTSKIFMRDDMFRPLLAMTIALPLDAKQHLSTKLERLLEEHIFLRKNRDLFLSLTNREQEILKLLAKSCSAAEIAEKLIISIHTVETHRKNLRKKLGITTPYELNRFASAFDLI